MALPWKGSRRVCVSWVRIPPFPPTHWSRGRAVDYSSLLNCRTFGFRGFESLRLRQPPNIKVTAMAGQLAEAFCEFHHRNPMVYKLFEDFTFRVIKAGYRRYSADAVMHRVRWETSIETTGDSFKINDHHVAYYGRYFMMLHPQFSGFFRTRTISADDETVMKRLFE